MVQGLATCYAKPAEFAPSARTFPGQKIAHLRPGLVQEQRPILHRGLDLAAFMPFVPGSDQHPIGSGSNRFAPQHAVGLAVPALGDRPRLRTVALAIVVTRYDGYRRYLAGPCRADQPREGFLRPGADLGRRLVL